MRRSFRSSRGSPFQNSGMRLISMLCLLLVIGMIYNRARRPETWQWFTGENREAELAESPPAELREAPAHGEPLVGQPPDPATSPPVLFVGTPPEPASVPASPPNRPKRPWESVVPGPTDLSVDEQAEVRTEFEVVADKEPLAKFDMPAYWRLLRWARAQRFSELEGRAERSILFTQLWEQPEKYRGRLLRLRLHIKRILKYETPENSGGLTHLYEAWGWTEDSKSFPYVVVFPELPPGMKIGADVHAEGVFVGYFLKTMAYTAYDVNRAAPLLLGRMKGISNGATAARDKHQEVSIWEWLTGAALIGLVAAWIWWKFGRKTEMPVIITPRAEADMEAWLQESPADGTPSAPAPLKSGIQAVEAPPGENLPPPATPQP